MLIYYAVGQLSVQQARTTSQSALPNARVIPDQPAEFRIRTARALHRLAERIGPIDTPAGGSRPETSWNQYRPAPTR